jgi:arginine-tRNA-protein transferase
VPVADFKPSRSQRRVAKRGAHLRVEYGAATCTPEKLRLFNRHKQERGLASLEDGLMTEEGYASWLLRSCFHTMEMRYYLEDRLVGVGVIDLGRVGVSSVYFYFDPDSEVSALSPGVLSVLQEIAFCRRTGRDWLYLGLYVEDCRHLSYKSSYRPNERLLDGDWRLTD